MIHTLVPPPLSLTLPSPMTLETEFCGGRHFAPFGVLSSPGTPIITPMAYAVFGRYQLIQSDVLPLVTLGICLK